MATPIPPPIHSVARPFFAFLRCISNNRVFKIRQPEAPMGCPIAIAPPFTLTIDGSQPISLFTAHACAAKASLDSFSYKSLTCLLAFSKAFLEAPTGPIPIIEGSTPTVA